MDRNRSLGRRLKLSYGVGQLAEGVATNALNTFIFFYYTAVLGLSGTLAGTAMFISLAIDAFADPAIGSYSDNLRTRWGRRHPPMAVSLLPIAGTLALLFSAPAGLGQGGLFAWLTAFAVVHRIALSAFLIPFTALGAEISTDYRERSSIVIYRLTFANIGGIVALLLGYGVFLRGPRGLLDPSAYPALGWTLAALVVAAIAVSVLGTLRAGPSVTPLDRDPRALHRRVFGEIAEVFRNSSFRVLFAGLVLFYVALGAHLTLGLHANSFFWRLPTDRIQVVAIAFFGGLFVGMAFVPLLADRFEKRTIVLAGMLLLCLTLGAPATARLLGVLMLEGAPLVTLLAVNAVLTGVGATLAGVAYSSMLGDAADEHEQLFGTRREGLYFAGLGFAGKAAGGVGTIFAGIGLDLVGFPKDLAGRAATSVAIAPDALAGLGFIYGPGTALVAAISAITLLGYHIDRRRHAEILRCLRAEIST